MAPKDPLCLAFMPQGNPSSWVWAGPSNSLPRIEDSKSAAVPHSREFTESPWLLFWVLTVFWLSRSKWSQLLCCELPPGERPAEQELQLPWPIVSKQLRPPATTWLAWKQILFPRSPDDRTQAKTLTAPSREAWVRGSQLSWPWVSDPQESWNNKPILF